MLKQQANLIRKITIAIDSIVIVAAFVFAYEVRSAIGALDDIREYLWILLAVLPTWYFLSIKFGLYNSGRIQRTSQILAAVYMVHITGAMVTAAVIYLFEPKGFSRGLFGYFILISFLLICIEKLLFKLVLSVVRIKGYNFRNILIVGTDAKALELAKMIEAHAHWGLRVIGFLEHDLSPDSTKVNGYAILGRLEDIIAVCKQHAVDEVVFHLPKDNMSAFDGYLFELEGMGITVRMVINLFFASRFQRTELSYFHNQIPMMTFYSKEFDAGQLFLKRCLDIVGAMVGLGLTALLFPFIAIAIKGNSPGPLFFGQKRVGQNGRLFTCWKFRSMYVDAEERKKNLMHLNEMKGAIFKIANDPRITTVGKFLRETSLDELPQFWNVLRGEMSLVGTRPPTPDEVANYESWHRKRICIKPGITGLWQVSGRNQIRDFDGIVRLDLKYIEQWSLWRDIKILFKTIWVLCKREGSC